MKLNTTCQSVASLYVSVEQHSSERSIEQFVIGRKDISTNFSSSVVTASEANTPLCLLWHQCGVGRGVAATHRIPTFCSRSGKSQLPICQQHGLGLKIRFDCRLCSSQQGDLCLLQDRIPHIIRKVLKLQDYLGIVLKWRIHVGNLWVCKEVFRAMFWTSTKVLGIDKRPPSPKLGIISK